MTTSTPFQISKYFYCTKLTDYCLYLCDKKVTIITVTSIVTTCLIFSNRSYPTNYCSVLIAVSFFKTLFYFPCFVIYLHLIMCFNPVNIIVLLGFNFLPSWMLLFFSFLHIVNLISLLICYVTQGQDKETGLNDNKNKNKNSFPKCIWNSTLHNVAVSLVIVLFVYYTPHCNLALFQNIHRYLGFTNWFTSGWYQRHAQRINCPKKNYMLREIFFMYCYVIMNALRTMVIMLSLYRYVK